jgi:hypothetical protein
MLPPSPLKKNWLNAYNFTSPFMQLTSFSSSISIIENFRSKLNVQRKLLMPTRLSQGLIFPVLKWGNAPACEHFSLLQGCLIPQ